MTTQAQRTAFNQRIDALEAGLKQELAALAQRVEALETILLDIGGEDAEVNHWTDDKDPEASDG